MSQTGPRPDAASYALEVVGERWTLRVVRELMLGTHRYEQLREALGAPRDQLSARLRTLVSAGLVERRRYSERPERFEYHLTAAGLELRPILLLLQAFGERHVLGGATPPAVTTHTCGAVFAPVLACGYCGEPESGDGVTTRWNDPRWAGATGVSAAPAVRAAPTRSSDSGP